MGKIASYKKETVGTPVYQVMTDWDTFDIALISVIESLTIALMKRNEKNLYRLSRLETLFNKMNQVEKSYEGYIDEPFQNASKKFVKMLHIDLNTMVQNLKLAKDEKCTLKM